MWGLLSSSKEGAEADAPPATNSAPPPMMFNPQTTNSTIKPRTSRNPLSRQKRPAASGSVINQAQLQNQPLSPTGQPLSPRGDSQNQAQSPVSPSAQPSFNAFPNFNTSDTHGQTTEQQQVRPNAGGFNQYLSNFDYGNSTSVGNSTDSVPNDNNQISNNNQFSHENHQTEQSAQNNQYAHQTQNQQVNQYQQDNQYEQQNQYQPHPNQYGQQDYPAGGWNESHQQQQYQNQFQQQPEETGEPLSQQTQQQSAAVDAPEQQQQGTNETQQPEQSMIMSEEEYNRQWFEHSGTYPPEGSWQQYYEQWTAYYQSLGGSQPAEEQNNTEVSHQQQQPQYEQQQQHQQQYQQQEGETQLQWDGQTQQMPAYDPSQSQNFHQNEEMARDEAQFNLNTRERYDSRSSNRGRHESFGQQSDSSNRARNESISQQSDSSNRARHESSGQQVEGHERQPHVSESFPNQTESFPENSFFNNVESAHQSTPNNDSARFFAPNENYAQQNTSNFFDQAPQPDKNLNNMAPFNSSQQNEDPPTSLANPDNPFQKERDSTTPLWEKRDLNMVPDREFNPPNNHPPSTQNNHQNSGDTPRSRHSSSTVTGDLPFGMPGERVRSSSSTSRSLASEPRSRTTSANFRTEPPSQECVQPPPQFNDFSAGPSIVPPPTFAPSAFAPVGTLNPSPHLESLRGNTHLTPEPNNQGQGASPEPPKFNLGSPSEESLEPIPSQSSNPSEPPPMFPNQQTGFPAFPPMMQPPNSAPMDPPAPNLTPAQQAAPPPSSTVEPPPPEQIAVSPPQNAFTMPPSSSNGQTTQGRTMPAPLQSSGFGSFMPPPQTNSRHAEMKLPSGTSPAMPPSHQPATSPPEIGIPTSQSDEPIPPPQTNMMMPPPQSSGIMPPPQSSGFMPPPQSSGVMPPQQSTGVMPPQQSFGSMPPTKPAGLTVGSMPPNQPGGTAPASQFSGMMPPPQFGGMMPPPQAGPMRAHQPFSAAPPSTQNTTSNMPDSVLMPPPPNEMYERINLSKNSQKKPSPSPSLNYNNITFARPIGQSESRGSSRPPSRGSDDTIARLRKEYEERKILRRATPDQVANISGGGGIGTPLMNSTANNQGTKNLSSMSMKNLRSMEKASSLIAQMDAYENVELRNQEQGSSYENHELFASKKPVLPPKPTPSLPPRPSRKDARSERSTSAQDTYGDRGHRRNNSSGSNQSYNMSETKSRTRYGHRDRSEGSRTRDDRSMYDRQDPRYAYDYREDPRDRYRMMSEYERERYRQEMYRREEMYRRGIPDEYYRDRYYRDASRNYPGYDYERRAYYADPRYDRSDELSISRTESIRSDPASQSVTNETDEGVDLSEPAKIDTEDLLSTTDDSKSNVLDDSQDLEIEPESTDSKVDESVEEPEIIEETGTALADMYIAPYLYTQCHVRAQCFAPNKFLCVVPNEDDNSPHMLEISDFKLLYWQELKEIEEYPGPFIKGETPKRDVMKYCQRQASLLRKEKCTDEGKILLWELLGLLCKQNGVVIGTDVAELLLADQDTTTSYSKTNIAGYDSDGQLVEISDEQKTEAINQIRECLFEGQRKEALEVSVKYHMWSLALMISTTLAPEIMSDTMRRFSASLHVDEPLRSFSQLVSQVEPSACSSTTRWRQHLAMILSNQSDKYDPNFNYALSLANTLASEGMVHASHFTSLMAGSKLTSVLDKTSPIALLGLDHTKELQKLPYSAIQLTEIYEYAKLLGGEPCIVPFQAVKLFYAKEVAKVGLYSKALQYLQQISHNINMSSKSYRARFISRVYEECVRLVHLLHRPLPEWVEMLRETLKNRNLGISNRSTAYSSRVATPDIQRVAQYLLHKQKQTDLPAEQPASQQSTESLEGNTAQQQQQQQSAQHQELLANGLVFDGQVYRHPMYPGYVYYEGEWYPDQQQDTTQQTTNTAYQYDQSGQYGGQLDQTGQLNQTEQSDQSGQADQSGQQYDPEGGAQNATQLTHDSAQSNHEQHQTYQNYDHSQQNYNEQTQQGYDSSQLNYDQSQTSYDSSQATADLSSQYGYDSTQQPDYSTHQGSDPQNSTSQYSEQAPPTFYSRNDVTTPRNDVTTPQGDDVTETDGLSGQSPRQRQDTLTNEEPVEETVEEAAPPPPGGFTFFNPSQFGSSNMMAPMVSPLVPPLAPPSSDRPLSDDEIKTPTNDPVEDDPDSLYSTKKPEKKEAEKKEPEKKKENSEQSTGLFSRLFKKSEKPKRMNLPDDSKPAIHWDEDLKKWVGGSDDEDDAPPPPPTSSLPPSSRSSIVSGGSEDRTMSAPGSPGGSFRRKPGRGRLANRYVDVMGGSGMTKSATTPNFR